VLPEEGQSRMRAEGLPVDRGLVSLVNKISMEERFVFVAGFAVLVVSLFKYEVVDLAKLEFVDVCVCAVDAAPVRRERPAAMMSTRVIATNAQNVLLLRVLNRRSEGSSCFCPEPK
jgi:hypothetical protein